MKKNYDAVSFLTSDFLLFYHQNVENVKSGFLTRVWHFMAPFTRLSRKRLMLISIVICPLTLQKMRTIFDFWQFINFLSFQKIEEMNEQLRDLMMHFEAQNKLQEALRTNQVTEQVS